MKDAEEYVKDVELDPRLLAMRFGPLRAILWPRHVTEAKTAFLNMLNGENLYGLIIFAARIIILMI